MRFFFDDAIYWRMNADCLQCSSHSSANVKLLSMASCDSSSRTELAAKILSRYHFGAAFVTQADDFHSLGSASAKAFDGEHDSVRRLIRDANEASRYVCSSPPTDEERLVYCAAYFPGHRGLAAAFADFDGAGGKEILQARVQLFGEFSYQYHNISI
jgi:hypothetical protein